MVKYSVSILLPAGDYSERSGLSSAEAQEYIVQEVSRLYPYVPVKMSTHIFCNFITRPHLSNAVLKNLVIVRRSGLNH